MNETEATVPTPATTWEPTGDQVIVRPLASADRTQAGILLPQEGRERPQKGIVLRLSPSRSGPYPGDHAVQPGDLVAFGKYAGIEFDLDGFAVLLMRDTEILARKPAGTYALVFHGDDPRKSHEAGLMCEHCEMPRSGYLEEERERLRREREVSDVAQTKAPECREIDSSAMV